MMEIPLPTSKVIRVRSKGYTHNFYDLTLRLPVIGTRSKSSNRTLSETFYTLKQNEGSPPPVLSVLSHASNDKYYDFKEGFNYYNRLMITPFLTEAERTQYVQVPKEISSFDLLASFHLSYEDLRVVRLQRRPSNRLGFALQLGLLRFMGFLPEGWMSQVPAGVVAFAENGITNSSAPNPALY